MIVFYTLLTVIYYFVFSHNRYTINLIFKFLIKFQDTKLLSQKFKILFNDEIIKEKTKHVVAQINASFTRRI
jgi:hypothetical protein